VDLSFFLVGRGGRERVVSRTLSSIIILQLSFPTNHILLSVFNMITVACTKGIPNNIDIN
jgi:hypothetical protein